VVGIVEEPKSIVKELEVPRDQIPDEFLDQYLLSSLFGLVPEVCSFGLHSFPPGRRFHVGIKLHHRSGPSQEKVPSSVAQDVPLPPYLES
jgi:hypothetical protein